MRAYQFIIEYNQRVTLERQGPRIAPIAAQQGVDDPAVALAALEQMDPTAQQRNNPYRYMIWIINQFVQGKFRLEDVERVKKALTSFEENKSSLPDSERDIGRYDMKKLVDTIEKLQNPTNIYQQFLNRSDIDVLYVGPYGLLAIPLTHKSSCELGSNTRWCTAWNTNSHFNRYSRQGPLYVWIDRSGQKYQFHFPSNQFMDASDSRISDATLKKLMEIPPIGELLNNFRFLLAVKREGLALRYVPRQLKTEEMCLAAVKQNGLALRYVPRQLRTERMCLAAIKQDGTALRSVPRQLRTERMCLAAVKKNGRALQYVPDELKTEEMFLEAVKQVGEAIRYIPRQLRTEQVCLAAIKKVGWALQYVPDELKTEEMCLAAVYQDGYALAYVPEQLKTEGFYLKVVNQDGEALRYVPEQLKTEGFYLKAVKQNGWALYYVPERLKTEEFCLKAVKQNGRALKYIPERLKTEEFYLAAVKQDGYALQYVPEQLRTPRMIRAAKENT